MRIYCVYVYHSSMSNVYLRENFHIILSMMYKSYLSIDSPYTV